MNTRETRNRIMASVNELAAFIRENAPVSFGEVCVKKHIAPSTLYNYMRILKDMVRDIKYENGIFYVTQNGEVTVPTAARVEIEGSGS